MNSSSALASEWQLVGPFLGLEVVAPYEVVLESNARVVAKVFIKQFGGRKGILIVDDLGQLKGHDQELTAAGYGFSFFNESESDGTVGDLDGYKELLCDWTWCGDGPEPAWMEEYRRSTDYRIYLVVDPALMSKARLDYEDGVWVATGPDGKLPEGAPPEAIVVRRQPGEAADAIVVRAIREIDAFIGSNPYWSHIDVLGATLTPAIEAAAKDVFAEHIESTADGFRLIRRYGW